METYGTAGSIFDVKGKKALVTGGTKGLGREMTACLLENGCDVFVASRNISGHDDLRQAARDRGVELYFHACDISKAQAAVEMAAEAEKSMGRIDILINSAGMNILKFITELDEESWDAVLNLNLRAVFIVTREVAGIMKKQKYGKIINMSSMKSVLGTSDFGYSAYCSSKGALNMFTKQAACELAAHNITVNAIAPTFIRTDINAFQLDNSEFRQTIEARIPLGRVGQFKDLMGLLLLLASDASSFITGQIFLLDGGISASQ
jgi:gluconate 5-dehydrogenase